MVVGGQRHTPAVLPAGKTRYPMYRRLGGPQSLSRRVRKISPTPGFDPQTVQPVASRCTDSAIPVHNHTLNKKNPAYHLTSTCMLMTPVSALLQSAGISTEIPHGLSVPVRRAFTEHA
jgi:hypothetical protein